MSCCAAAALPACSCATMLCSLLVVVYGAVASFCGLVWLCFVFLIIVGSLIIAGSLIVADYGSLSALCAISVAARHWIA